jgi:hypothetical protein
LATHNDHVADARNRAAVEECAAVMVASVVQRALSGGDEDDAGAAVSEQAGGSSVSVTASPYVTQIAMRLLAACDAADYERAVALFLICDACLRLSEDAIRAIVSNVKGDLPPDERDRLSDAVASVLRADIGASAPLMVQRLREAALPSGLQVAYTAVLKQWKKKRMLDSEHLEAFSAAAKTARDGGGADAAAAETAAEPPAQPPAEAPVDVDDLTAEGGARRRLPADPPSKKAVRSVAALLKETFEVLSALPPATAAPLWNLLPADDALTSLVDDGAALAKVRTALGEAKAARETAKAAAAVSAAKARAGTAGKGDAATSALLAAGGSQIVPLAASFARTPTAPVRLQCDVKRLEIPTSREQPAVRRNVKPTPYSFSHQLMQAGVVGRRSWGMSVDTWWSTKDLASGAPCVTISPAVPNSPGILML